MNTYTIISSLWNLDKKNNVFVAADGLAPFGARESVGTVMAKFIPCQLSPGRCIYQPFKFSPGLNLKGWLMCLPGQHWQSAWNIVLLMINQNQVTRLRYAKQTVDHFLNIWCHISPKPKFSDAATTDVMKVIINPLK